MYLTIGQLPDIWKNFQITPIFKNKGSAHVVNSYSPKSNISDVCKSFEKNLFKHTRVD